MVPRNHSGLTRKKLAGYTPESNKLYLERVQCNTYYSIMKYSPLWPSKINKYGRNYKKIRRLYPKNLREGNLINIWETSRLKINNIFCSFKCVFEWFDHILLFDFVDARLTFDGVKQTNRRPCFDLLSRL